MPPRLGCGLGEQGVERWNDDWLGVRAVVRTEGTSGQGVTVLRGPG